MQAPVETLMKHSSDALRISIYKTATYWSRLMIYYKNKKKDERCLWVLPGKKKFVILASGLLNEMYSPQLLQHIHNNYFSLTLPV